MTEAHPAPPQIVLLLRLSVAQVPMVLRLAHLLVLDVLSVSLGLRLGAVATERLCRSKQALRTRRIRETDS